jgi:hypothetical protein
VPGYEVTLRYAATKYPRRFRGVSIFISHTMNTAYIALILKQLFMLLSHASTNNGIVVQ